MCDQIGHFPRAPRVQEWGSLSLHSLLHLRKSGGTYYGGLQHHTTTEGRHRQSQAPVKTPGLTRGRASRDAYINRNSFPPHLRDRPPSFTLHVLVTGFTYNSLQSECLYKKEILEGGEMAQTAKCLLAFETQLLPEFDPQTGEAESGGIPGTRSLADPA